MIVRRARSAFSANVYGDIPTSINECMGWSAYASTHTSGVVCHFWSHLGSSRARELRCPFVHSAAGCSPALWGDDQPWRAADLSRRRCACSTHVAVACTDKLALSHIASPSFKACLAPPGWVLNTARRPPAATLAARRSRAETSEMRIRSSVSRRAHLGSGGTVSLSRIACGQVPRRLRLRNRRAQRRCGTSPGSGHRGHRMCSAA